MNPVVLVSPWFPGEPFPRTGNAFGSITAPLYSDDQQVQAITTIGSMGFFTMQVFDAFSDFVYELPYFGEQRTLARDVDFGFFSAQHSFREVDGKMFLLDMAPEWPREQDRETWGPGSGAW